MGDASRSLSSSPRLDGWPEEVVGSDLRLDVGSGRSVQYAFLDNAASTPAMHAAANAVSRLLPWYSSVHRGTGLKSRVATATYELSRQAVARFVGASEGHSVVFCKNTTEGLNRLAALASEKQMTVFITALEHHANMLPWRYAAPAVRYVATDSDGILDQEDLASQLNATPGPKLLAVAGAYNVTGYVPPIHDLARIAHRHGAQIVVDGAQLVPHRRVRMGGDGPGGEIDYLVFSGHKIYAPFGSGALVAATEDLESARPYLLGGGIVESVTLDDVLWNGAPDREEAGSPNLVGVVALAAALNRLDTLGREEVAAHEEALTTHLLDGLNRIGGLTILGPGGGPDRVGVISFHMAGIHHSLVARYLSHEHGLGVRSGRFCAHPGVMKLLGVDQKSGDSERDERQDGIQEGLAGAVRVSLGLQNTKAEVDRLLAALSMLRSDGPRSDYRRDLSSGDYVPTLEPSDPRETALAVIGDGER